MQNRALHLLSCILHLLSRLIKNRHPRHVNIFEIALGAAEALREDIHAPIQSANQVHYERMIALGQGVAEEEPFRTWWMLGRELSYEAAVALV